MLIFQHEPCEGLGYLDTFLAERRIEHHIVHLHKGESVPDTLTDISGMVFLGSSHSVNDGLDWIEDELALIRKASQADLPVLGICFGGQLISKALGGEVSKARTMQAGWFEVTATKQAETILGNTMADSFTVFEWHGDMFSLPEGATPLFYGNCVKYQGFLHSRCLALQFHPEFTRNKIEKCLSRNPALKRSISTCVQNSDEMLKDLNERLDRLHAVAKALFAWWLEQAQDSNRRQAETRQERTNHRK